MENEILGTAIEFAAKIVSEYASNSQFKQEKLEFIQNYLCRDFAELNEEAFAQLFAYRRNNAGVYFEPLKDYKAESFVEFLMIYYPLWCEDVEFIEIVNLIDSNEKVNIDMPRHRGKTVICALWVIYQIYKHKQSGIAERLQIIAVSSTLYLANTFGSLISDNIYFAIDTPTIVSDDPDIKHYEVFRKFIDSMNSKVFIVKDEGIATFLINGKLHLPSISIACFDDAKIDNPDKILSQLPDSVKLLSILTPCSERHSFNVPCKLRYPALSNQGKPLMSSRFDVYELQNEHKSYGSGYVGKNYYERELLIPYEKSGEILFGVSPS